MEIDVVKEKVINQIEQFLQSEVLTILHNQCRIYRKFQHIKYKDHKKTSTFL